MPDLSARALRTIRSHALIGPGERVVVAVSGGADSVALLHVLCELGGPVGFAVAAVAHLNHRLREAADADAAFCRQLAEGLGLPFDTDAIEVASLAGRTGRSLEDAGRTARYAFLEASRRRHAAHVVAVGHTRDDQAETFLLKLLRGAGPQGLAGIYPRRGTIVRPLIDAARGDVTAYLSHRGLAHREDETNADRANPRNRVRHELIPYVRRHFSPRVTDVLARAAAIAREDAEHLDRLAEAGVRQSVQEVSGHLEIDAACLSGQPMALARRIARRALGAVGGRFVGFDHVDALLRLAEPTGRDTMLDLPGVRAERRGGRIRLVRSVGRARGAVASGLPRAALPVPGRLPLSGLDLVLTAERRGALSTGERADLAARGDCVVLEACRVAEPLAVRSRRPGDLLRPLGLGGRKKLQDFFVDRKVARSRRDLVPLVVDARDRIVWVVGETLADDFRVTGGSQGVIILKAKRLVGGAG